MMNRIIWLALLIAVPVWAQFAPFERPQIVATSNFLARGSITLGGVERSTWPAVGGGGVQTNDDYTVLTGYPFTTLATVSNNFIVASSTNNAVRGIIQTNVFELIYYNSYGIATAFVQRAGWDQNPSNAVLVAQIESARTNAVATNLTAFAGNNYTNTLGTTGGFTIIVTNGLVENMTYSPVIFTGANIGLVDSTLWNLNPSNALFAAKQTTNSALDLLVAGNGSNLVLNAGTAYGVLSNATVPASQVVAPAGQVLFGTGTGSTTDPDFFYSGGKLFTGYTLSASNINTIAAQDSLWTFTTTNLSAIAGYRYSNDTPGGIGLRAFKARGTPSAPLPPLSGDYLFSIAGGGWLGTTFTSGMGMMHVMAAENWGNTNAGTYIDFWTTPIGSTNRQEFARFTDLGHLLLGSTNDDLANFLQVTGSGNFSTGLTVGGTNVLIANEVGTSNLLMVVAGQPVATKWGGTLVSGNVRWLYDSAIYPTGTTQSAAFSIYTTNSLPFNVGRFGTQPTVSFDSMPGTVAAWTPPASNATLAILQARSVTNNNGALISGPSLRFFTSESWSNGTRGAGIKLYGVPQGATADMSIMDIFPEGVVIYGNGLTITNKLTVSGNVVINSGLQVGSGSTQTFFRIVSHDLDFGSVAAGGQAETNVLVTGATVNDVVSIGMPAVVSNNLWVVGYCSVADTVTVRCLNNDLLTAIDPASQTYKVKVER